MKTTNERAPQLILALDTSGADAGLVLAGEDGVSALLLPRADGGAARTEDLAGQAARLLRERGRSARDLTAVAAVVGPGSYTGLRSGLAFLRGLAFADSLPAVAVGALELLAFRGGGAGEPAIVVCAAGKSRSTIAAYRCSAGGVEEIAAPWTVDDEEVAQAVAENPHHATLLVLASEPGIAVRAAAEAAGLEVRVATGGGAQSLGELAVLVRAKLARGEAQRAETILPFYVGQTAARPNTHRVAALRRPE